MTTTLAKTISPQRQAELAQEALIAGMKLRDTLGKLNLQPELIRKAFVVAHHGLVVAFYPLEMQIMERDIGVYQSKLHHLSSTLSKPMAISNSRGFRYAVLLERPKRLPEMVELQRVRTGRLQLGISPSRQVMSVPWQETGHILVAGMTRFGKTNAIRNFAYQALRDEHQLLLGDLSRTAFPMLKNHPGVLGIAENAEGYLEIVRDAHKILGEREIAYSNCPGFPEVLDEYNTWATKAGRERFPHVLVILDEYNSVAESSPEVKDSVTSLANQGLKFGVKVVLASQDFSMDVLGKVRDQMGLVMAFKVKNVHVARNLGLAKASTLNRPGLALTDRFGPIQVFFMAKQKLIELGRQGTATPLPISPQEQKLFEHALREEDGKMAYTQIMEWVGEWGWGWSHGKVRKLLETWEHKNWIAKNQHLKNARYITDTVADRIIKLSNASNSLNGVKHPQNAIKQA